MLALLLAASPFAAVQGYAYDDYSYIVNTGIDTSVPQTLAVTSPSDGMKTTASAYYITGTSNPNYTLTVNGSEVTGRGQYGSFGVYVSLDMGDNVFTFRQGDTTRSITITRVSPSQTVSTTDRLSSMVPSSDDIAEPGETYTLQCVGPSGATITASIAGEEVTLKQAASANEGVPATFTGKVRLPSSSRVKSLGQVTYTLRWNGTTTEYQSAGTLYIAPEDSPMVAMVNQTASLTYGDADATTYGPTLRYGSNDVITDTDGSMFQLGIGSWISKSNVLLLPDASNCVNEVSAISYETDSEGERFIFQGTAQPAFTVSETDEQLEVTFYNTYGIDDQRITDSRMFTDIAVTSSGSRVTFTFDKSSPNCLWGYNVSYDSNETTLFLKYPPTLTGGSDRPLEGMVIALDAGHGGNDNGAAGTSGLTGPTEKTLALDIAIATQRRLESLGAQVILTRSGDDTMTMNDRMDKADLAGADLFISLHYNSIAHTSDGTKPSGTEIYYYHEGSRDLAQTLLDYITSYTGRTNRGVKRSNFRVTLNTFAPSVLVELGFLTNPVEYDNICSPRQLYNAANAIGDAIVEYMANY